MREAPEERLVLILEDNPEHIHIIRAVFAANTFKYKIVTIGDGIQALEFLHRKGEYETALRPDLILLDLNLPGKDGREILSEIKATPQLRRIPVVVFTLSDSEADIRRAYELQGNCYVIKPSDLEQLSQIVKRIQEFWLEIVTLPIE